MRGIKQGLIPAATIVLLLLGSCDWLSGILGGEIDPYEPNDSIAEAYPIELGKSYTAYISENDADFFSFRPAHGADTFDAVEIRVTDVGPDLIIGLALYDNRGSRFTQQTVSTRGADLTFTLRTPGLPTGHNYYIRFSGTWGHHYEVDGYGDYRGEGPYTFRVRNLNENDEFAPNHTIDTAYPINLGQSYNGVLVSQYERDFYEFEAGAETMSFDVTNTGPDLNVGLVVYDSNREVIRKANVGTPGASLSQTWSGFGIGDTYYVRFTGTWPHHFEVDGDGDLYSRGPYTFVVNNDG